MSIPRNTINETTSTRHVQKYWSRNPIQRILLNRFFRRIRSWIDRIRPTTVLDFGCGEALFWLRLANLGPLPNVVGLDLRADALIYARSVLPEFTFIQAELLEFTARELNFDLVIASEVLEHLYHPRRYLQRLCELSTEWILLTVPHEPYFRLCNLLRGRDIWSLGNHPEHVQQWSKKGFARFASEFVDIEELTTSFPFILLLGKTKRRSCSIVAPACGATHLHPASTGMLLPQNLSCGEGE